MEQDITLEVLDAISDTSSDGADNTVTKIKDKAKAYSERLNKDRANIKANVEKETINKLSEYLGVDISKFDKEEIDNAIALKIGESDSVKNANKLIEAENAKKLETIINDNISKISKVDNTITSLEDLAKHEKYEDIDAKIKLGYSIYDAYITTVDISKNDQLSQRRTGSVGHITFTQPETMSNETLSFYKKAFPNKSDEEIVNMYKRDNK